MPRHRGQFKPEREEPYEISRGKVENFIQCSACFWLDRVKGVHFPGMPGFNLNSNTDTLLKRDFDQYRGIESHPIMRSWNLDHLIPFAHEDLKKWETSLHFGLSNQHFNTIHEETNLCFGGGLDDVWQNSKTHQLHIVDYKSTAQLGKEPKPLDRAFLNGPWKGSYKRQMDMYQWIMRRKGFDVSNLGFFVYVDGQHIGQSGMIDPDDTSKANMLFNTSIIEYSGDDSWVEPALYDIKELLHNPKSPPHTEGCENERFLTEAANAISDSNIS